MIPQPPSPKTTSLPRRKAREEVKEQALAAAKGPTRMKHRKTKGTVRGQETAKERTLTSLKAGSQHGTVEKRRNGKDDSNNFPLNYV